MKPQHEPNAMRTYHREPYLSTIASIRVWRSGNDTKCDAVYPDWLSSAWRLERRTMLQHNYECYFRGNVTRCSHDRAMSCRLVELLELSAGLQTPLVKSELYYTALASIATEVGLESLIDTTVDVACSFPSPSWYRGPVINSKVRTEVAESTCGRSCHCNTDLGRVRE